MFIRKRRSNRADSYQIIESYRENRHVRQRALANLGPYPTVEEALHELRQEVAHLEARAERLKTQGRWRAGKRPLSRASYGKAMREIARLLELRRTRLERLETVVANNVPPPRRSLTLQAPPPRAANK